MDKYIVFHPRTLVRVYSRSLFAGRGVLLHKARKYTIAGGENVKTVFKKSLRVALPVILACLILAGCLAKTPGDGSAAFVDITGSYSDQFAQLMKNNFANSVLQNEKKYETRTVLISLSEKTLVDYAGGGSVSDYLLTDAGQKKLEKIRSQQDKLLKKLDKAGIEYELEYRYTAIDNAVAITVDTSHVAEIKKMSGVKSVVIARSYAAPKTQTDSGNGSSSKIENITSVYKTGIYDSELARKDGYTGAGMVVAILDTGLDYTHKAFQEMPPAETLRFDRSTIAAILAKENLRAEELTEGGLTVDDVFYNEKVPFMYDYADHDANVYPSYSNHGTHVAGIVAGHDKDGYIDKDGNPVTDEEFWGVAPEAQLVICKVFTDDLESQDLGGAETEDILAALEDCVILGVDVINMSLGTTCGFTSTDDGDDEGEYLNRVYSMVGDAGISLVCAASNDYSAGFGGVFGTNLSSNPDSGTVGSPSTFPAALSVASISGKKSNYLIGNGKDAIFFQDSNDGNSNPFDFIGDMLGDTQQKSFEYVVIPGVGSGADYTTSIQELVKGRIALVERGDTTFQDKVELARDYGAIGIIIYNNVSGTVRMSLGDVKNPIPAISIDMKSGQKLVEKATGRVGTLTLDKSYAAGPFMSDFSSWGATSDLKLKPEITAHGGEITSTVPGSYGEQSGTSMASPNMAGVVALLRSYVQKNFDQAALDALKKGDESNAVVINRLVYQLLMSTAVTVVDQDALPYSPRKQGAGLGSLENSRNTKAYLWVDNADNDYRPKFELGDDKKKTGEYTISFHISNFGTQTLSFRTNSLFMTESLSVDGMAVAEQAYLLTDVPAKWNVNGKELGDDEVFSIPAGEDYEVTLTVKLSDDEAKYINESFKNGMFVEGFAKLLSETDGQCDLALPFMGFYGDWTQAPMLDYDAYKLGEYQKDSSILDDEKPQASVWATQPYVTYQDDQYTLPMGSFLYLQNENADQIYAEMEHNSISRYNEYYGDRSVDNYLTSYKFRGLYAGLLRSARYVDYTLTNADTGEVLETDTIYRVGKAYAGAGSAAPAFVKFETDPTELGLVSGEKYTMSFDFYLDYENEERTGKKETYSFSFYADYEAPILQDVRVRYYDYKDGNKQKQRIYLDLDVYDNHYPQSVMLTYLDGNELKLATEYVTPVYNATRNGTTTVSIEITDIYEKYKNTLYVQVDDYALNHSNYWLNLSKCNTSLAPNEFELAEGEDEITIGIYESHKVSLMYDGDGNLSNFDWSSNNQKVANVKNGEIVGLSAGTTTITVTGSDGTRREIKVTVTDKVGKLPIPSISFENIKSGSGALASGNVEVYPGEEIDLEVKTDPWYYPSDGYSLRWMSTDEKVASVDQNGKVKTISEGTVAIQAILILNGEETPYSTLITLNVKDPFVVNGVTLTEYRGVGDENGVVEIPTDKNIMLIAEGAFEDNTKITEVVIPKTVMSIGKYAFRNCTALERVYFDSREEQEIADCDINIIYQEAFAGCTSLKLVDLTNVKILSLGRECFRDCTSLTEIRAMYKAATLFDRVFAGCTSLKTVDLSGLYVSGSYVFSGCTGLTNITTGSATSLGDYIFENCTGLRNVTISAAKVGDYAFKGCKNLTTVKFAPAQGESTSSTSIGVRAFADCEMLRSVTFADGAKIWSIGDYAFQNCTRLKSFTMPAGLSILGNDILAGSGVTTVVVGDDFDFGSIRLMGLTFGNLRVELEADCTRYRKIDGVIYNSDLTQLLMVTDEATHVTIPATVHTIGAYAFTGSSVTSLVIPDTVKTISTAAFANSALAKVTFAGTSTITQIPDYAFSGSKLLTIEVPASVTYIGTRAFAGTTLTAITFAGNNIRSVGDYAFCDCTLLTKIALPDAISVMGDGVFLRCTQLVDVTMPSVKVLGVSTFYGCSGLKTVRFGENATTLGDSRSVVEEYGEDPTLIPASTFFGCEKLTDVTIGAGVTQIDDLVFAGCTSLEHIDLRNVTVVGDNAFYGCLKLGTVNSLENVTQIGEYAFYCCNGLTSLNLASAEIIGDYAFAIESGNAYTEIRIPSAKQIGAMAFKGGNETTVTIPATLEKLGEGAFSYSKKLTGFTVESGNDKFFAQDGVLFRYFLKQDNSVSITSEFELCAFPGGKNLKDKTYTMPDGTTRISAYAFAGLSKNAPAEVILPWSVRVVGISAFYDSGIRNYTFHSIQAPVLGTEYREDIFKMMEEATSNTTMDEVAVNGLFYANFDTLMVYFTDMLGQESNLTMSYPANGVGYDNYVWTTYFGTRNKLDVMMDNETRDAIAAIEALHDPATIKGWETLENTDENRKMIEQFAKLVTSARRKLDNINDADQLAMVDASVIEKLSAVEEEMRTIKEKFGIALTIKEIKFSDGYKKDYIVGETFDLSSVELIIVYDDYSTEKVDMSKVTAPTEPLSKLDRIVELVYQDGDTRIEVPITIKVREASSEDENPGTDVPGDDTPATTAPNGGDDNQKNGGNATVVVLIIVGVLVIAAGVAALLLLRKKKQA